MSDPIEVSGNTPSNINCIPRESGVENICLLSTMPSKEYFCCTKGNIKSKNHVGILKDAGPLRSQLISRERINTDNPLAVRFTITLKCFLFITIKKVNLPSCKFD